MSFFNSYSKAVARQQAETGMTHGDFFVTVEAVMEEFTRAANDVQPVTPEVTETINHPKQDGIMPRTAEELEAYFDRSNRRSARPNHSNLKSKNTETQTKVRNEDNSQEERSGGMGRDTSKTKGKSNRSNKPSRSQRKIDKRTLKKLGGGYRVRVKIDRVVVNDSDCIRPG